MSDETTDDPAALDGRHTDDAVDRPPSPAGAGPDDDDRFYASVLTTMWDQYVKFLNVGFLGAAGFFGLTITIVKDRLHDAALLPVAIVLASVSGIAFLYCRLLSQILMERQVYGNFERARRYFLKAGGNLPRALTGETAAENRKYIRKLDRRNGWVMKMAVVTGFLGFVMAVASLIRQLLSPGS